ncbi:hydrogen peroxide-dependent heme synthase [Schumannella sp. 10F1B-5-1]|uniref:hydrogen peroxide-dependent heme synthase n=1 Tax=Schumannella sp. 10F1B-5-1 TaxID=2590780 RepID=UPI0011316819|nr:chlorite dismutase family protein [Schumannella sp. 10F1B-5-1]
MGIMSTDAPDRLGYALWAVFRRGDAPLPTRSTLEDALPHLDRLGVELRGLYDASGIRADSDLIVWLTGDKPENVQEALRALRRTDPISALVPVWNALGVHREAEFTRNHSPAFMKGLPPKQWLTVYPFVRSYEWYLLPEDERRTMLSDHGRKGSEYPEVQPNTVASFALGDYEWILGLEAEELVSLVDLMRHLRNTEARRHVREEVPFYTGRLIAPADILGVFA